MANISDWAEKFLLDYINTGATATRPTAWGLALSTAVPTASSLAEIGTASGYAAQTCTLAAAASPAGTSTNANAMTFGPFSTACTISGAAIKDTTATAGNLLWYGALATARTVGVGDSIVFAAGAINVSLT